MPTLAQLKAKWFLPLTGSVLGVPQIQADSDQPLLGPVVQVPSQASALLVGDGHDPRT